MCDFGSAGGTFVRLASGVPTPLYPSMMILLGKHQVRVFHNYCFFGFWYFVAMVKTRRR